MFTVTSNKELAHSPSGHTGQHCPGGVTGFSQAVCWHTIAEQSGPTERKMKNYTVAGARLFRTIIDETPLAIIYLHMYNGNLPESQSCLHPPQDTSNT